MSEHNKLTVQNWLGKFDERQRDLIFNCINYANGKPAGLPGHQLMLIVAQMADMLSDAEAENEKTQP